LNRRRPYRRVLQVQNRLVCRLIPSSEVSVSKAVVSLRLQNSRIGHRLGWQAVVDTPKSGNTLRQQSQD